MSAVKFLLFALLIFTAQLAPAQPAVDASTMNHKLLMGYQGWFACPGDGSLPDHWVHWFRKNNPAATNATVDFWPDVSELDADELFSTAMQLPDGSTAKAYSAFTKKTVVRHFRWMQENNLDGVFLQRFTSELSDPRFFALRNQVTANVQAGAEKYFVAYRNAIEAVAAGYPDSAGPDRAAITSSQVRPLQLEKGLT